MIDPYTKALKLSITSAVIVFSIIAGGLQHELASASSNEEESDAANNNSSNQPKSLDEYFYYIEKDIPGFAGYYYDEQGKLIVYLTNPADADNESIKNILVNKYLDSEDDVEKGIEIKKSDYSWEDWYSWKAIIGDFAINGDKNNAGENNNDGHTHVWSLDIDEKNQKIVVGLGEYDEERVNQINSFLVNQGIPENVLQIKKTDAIKNEAEITGGTSITVCTVGFVGKKTGGTLVGVTAGHCEPTPDSAGDQIFKFDDNTTAGTEIANTNNPGVRNGDSLLFSAAPGNTFTFGKMKTSSSFGSLTYTITGKKSFPAVGESIWHYGKSTGQSSGTILAADQTFFNAAAAPYTQLNSMDTADYALSSNGDSGGPVYKKTGSNIVIYGIHKGTISPTQKIFTPMHSIEADQGTLTVN